MRRSDPRPRGAPVPSNRFARLARFGGMAGGVAGNVARDAARRIAEGERPRLGDLLLTPANAARITRELAHLRGAAMKMGQLMSMEAGDFLPREITDILASLRADAQHMPPRQLRAVLDRRWGRGWLDRFAHFDPRPMAAASIGQVHRAETRDGRDLAIKIQYPGVRESIDSDVNNVAALIRMSGALPEGFDIAPMLAEAKRQLHEEADYVREGERLRAFGALLADDARFAVPALHEDLTCEDVLAMDFVPGVALEAIAEDAPQAERDAAAAALLDLALRELLDFRMMQTDPNFANYRYQRETGRIALLDFGATRDIPGDLAEGYRRLFRESLAGDGAAIRAAMVDLGFFDAEALARRETEVATLTRIGLDALHAPEPFDFGDKTIARRVRDEAMTLIEDRGFWRMPPPDILFAQRKFAGMYLLANRLGARLDLRALLERRL